MRSSTWILTSSFIPTFMVVALQSARAQDSLADRFPADAIFYVEADTRRLVEGALSLDLVKLLDEPQVREFLAPIAGELPVPVSSQGLRMLADSAHVRQVVDGRFELAFRGLHVEIGGQSFDVSPSKPIDAKQMNRLAGMAARMAEEGSLGDDVIVVPDFVACVDAGERFDEYFKDAMQHLGTASDSAQVGGREATRLAFSQGGPGHELFVVKDGKRRWIAGSAATLERCVKGGGGSQDSLSQLAAFRNFKQQVSSGAPAALVYVNVAQGARIFEKLVPPIVKEECDLLGISSIEAFGFASTFVEGGVRDCFALTYSSPPTGLVSLLDCTDGGFEFLKKAPYETGFYLGARVDLEAFVDKVATVVEELFPGTGRGVEMGLAQGSQTIGMDLRKELLSALGDEFGVYVTALGAGSLIPDGMVMLAVGDREQFDKLLARGLAEAGKQGVEASEIKSMPEGCKGWTLSIPEAPVQPAIAVTKDMFCVSMNVLALKKSLKEMQGRERTAADNPTLQRVLKGLTGSPNANGLSLLGFLDVQKLVELGYQALPMLPPEAMPPQIDRSALPESEVIARHFSGIGVAGRCDKKGISLSFFSPTGLLAPAMFVPAEAFGGGRNDDFVHSESVRELDPVVAEAEAEVATEVPAPKPAVKG